jgi:hypothetical protein
LLLLQKIFICLEETVLLSDMLVGFGKLSFGYFIKRLESHKKFEGRPRYLVDSPSKPKIHLHFLQNRLNPAIAFRQFVLVLSISMEKYSPIFSPECPKAGSRYHAPMKPQ